MGNIFEQDFIDFLEALNSCKVDYILVGGYAVILHGYNRTTGDLDVWVNPTNDNYKRLIKAFSEFGLPTNLISEERFLKTKEEDVFSFGRPPIAIDILTAVKGLGFPEALKNADVHTMDNLEIKLLSRADLILAKQAAGRYKDLNDIEHLEE